MALILGSLTQLQEENDRLKRVYADVCRDYAVARKLLSDVRYSAMMPHDEREPPTADDMKDTLDWIVAETSRFLGIVPKQPEGGAP